MHLHRPLAALALAAAGLAAAPAGASAATCGRPAVKSIVFETPAVVVTKGKARRQRGGGRLARIVACARVGARRTTVGAEYDVPGESGSSSILGLFGRNLLVEESGGGAESETVSRTVVDVRSGRRTERVIVGGTDFTGATAVSPAGLLALERDSRPELDLHRPGAPTRTLASGAGIDAIALGTRVAYWRQGTTVASAAVTPGATLPAGTPSRPPRGTRGSCEHRQVRTLFRVPSVRVFTSGASALVCTARAGARNDLRDPVGPALGSDLPTGVRDLQPIGSGLLAYRVPAGPRTGLVVFDVVNRRAVHAGVVDGEPTDVAFDPLGIVIADAGGVRSIVGRTLTSLDASGPASDPAIAAPADPDGAPVVFWTTPAGPRSR